MEESFGAVLNRLSIATPDATAVRYGDDVLSWRELNQRSDARAQQLLKAGVVRDDLVAIALPNGAAHHEWTFGAWKAGATPCILPYRLPTKEFNELLSLSAPRIVIGSSELVPTGVTSIAGNTPLPSEGWEPVACAPTSNWKAVASGGSTGRPKLIVDHGPPCMSARINQMVNLIGMPSRGVILNAGPLYHNAPFLFCSLALVSGSRVVGMERFDAEKWLQIVESEQIEWCFLVPTMMHRIWTLPPEVRGGYDLSSLKRIVHMAAACPIWLKQAWIDWLGPERILEGYAGTEGPGTMISGAEWLKKPGSVGRVSPDTITVRDTDGHQCPSGEVGEIFFPATSTDRFHYIGAAPRLDDMGRMSLGDMGYIDTDGYLFLADRRTDLIIRGGANIYPAEVEAALDEHPAVATAVAIGLPSDEFGQRVHAILEARPTAELAIEDVHAFVAERLAPYKRPESYEIIETQLRDDAGKVRRSALRAERLEWLQAGKPFQTRPDRD